MENLHIYTQPFINGKFVQSSSTAHLTIINPFTEQKLAQVDNADSSDVDAAVAAAHAGFRTSPWNTNFSPAQDGAVCMKLAELIARDAHEIATLEALSMGLPVRIGQLIATSLPGGIARVANLAGNVHGATSLHTPGALAITVYQPYGVCAAIIPWNVPFAIWVSCVLPCVMAGNAIVVKPSEKAPLTSLKLAALPAEAGFPAGIVNVVPGGVATGEAIAHHPRIARLSFNGSTETLKKIVEAAGRSNLKRVVAEGGGKSPVVVFDDAADSDKVASELATNAQFNSGQFCVSNSRIYVQSAILADFLQRFKEKFTTVVMGDPCDENTQFGPRASNAGANIVAGGKRATEEGYFIQPTILTSVPESAEIMKYEVFGPVVVIQQFDTEEDAVSRCNDSEFGLHAGICTKDLSRAQRVSLVFETGFVSVNCSSLTQPGDLAMGGWKLSGMGVEHGKKGLETYRQQKTIMMSR
ncbi:hypothetical protein PWT90_08776 [Aphanocladium album]|nr:hypothetical protein PWT90_08776 [Aphanocladium album]